LLQCLDGWTHTFNIAPRLRTSLKD